MYTESIMKKFEMENAKEGLCLKHLLKDLITEPLGPMVFYADNQSAMAMTQSLTRTMQGKHTCVQLL